MSCLGNQAVQADYDHDHILAIVKVAAATAALECADDPSKSARIQRSILRETKQFFPGYFDFEAEKIVKLKPSDGSISGKQETSTSCCVSPR
jgi:hypothetical protein